MEHIKLSSNREVSVIRVDIEDIYAFTLGGTPNARTTAATRASLLSDIKESSWDIEAIHIIDEQEEVLPRYRCIVELTSDPIEDGYDVSILVVCFFTDSININQVLLQERLSSLEWNALAGDMSVLSGRSRGL